MLTGKNKCRLDVPKAEATAASLTQERRVNLLRVRIFTNRLCIVTTLSTEQQPLNCTNLTLGKQMWEESTLNLNFRLPPSGWHKPPENLSTLSGENLPDSLWIKFSGHWFCGFFGWLIKNYAHLPGVSSKVHSAFPAIANTRLAYTRPDCFFFLAAFKQPTIHFSKSAATPHTKIVSKVGWTKAHTGRIGLRPYRQFGIFGFGHGAGFG